MDTISGVAQAVWRYRYVVLVAFLCLLGVDLVVSGIRVLLFEGGIFLFGVFVGMREQRRQQEMLTQQYHDAVIDLNRRQAPILKP